MTIYSYTYRITNIKEQKHYYGKRSCNINPFDDLGIIYFSSSKNKDFIQDQRNNPQNYKYKILFIFDNPTDALRMEIKLHNKFNVGRNPKFYNRAKQSSTSYDTTGMVSVKDKLGNTSLVSKLDSRYLSGELVGVTKGQFLVTDKDNNIIFTTKNNPRFISGELKTLRLGWAAPDRIFTETHKANLSKSCKGKKKSNLHKANLSKSLIENKTVAGKNHPRFKRYYVTPMGTFDTPAGLIPILSLSQMKNWCINNNRKISHSAYRQSEWLKENFIFEEIKDKTYKDLGFDIIPV